MVLDCVMFFVDLLPLLLTYRLFTSSDFAELASKLLICLLVSCSTAFPINAESPFTTPILVTNANPLLVGLKGRHLSPLSRRYLASAPVQVPYAPPVTNSHPPVGSSSSELAKKSGESAPPVEGRRLPLLAEAAPPQSRIPVPLVTPEVSSKSIFR